VYPVADVPGVGLQSGYGGCRVNPSVSFPPTGIVLEVSSTISAFGDTFLEIGWLPTGTTTSVRIFVVSGSVTPSIRMGEGNDIWGSTQFDPEAMRWWRLRPEAGALVGEISRNGTDWVELARRAIEVPSTLGLVDFGAQTYARDDVNPGRAVFESFQICR
jgi:hypothetical protein